MEEIQDHDLDPPEMVPQKIFPSRTAVAQRNLHVRDPTPTCAAWRRNKGPIADSGYRPLTYRAVIDVPASATSRTPARDPATD